MLTIAALTLLYFLPTIIAHKKPNFLGVFLLNFFLGWTVIGWFAALIWGIAAAPYPEVVVHHGYCCGCGTALQAAYCPQCGRAFAR